MDEPRSILHLDMDAFFAAVEQLDNPSLRGRPVLIGHDGPRGVVATASYEARPYGCHSAQPMAVAKRLCPHAVILPVRGERYREVSRRMFAILSEFSPVVEPLSIDEAFVDLAGTRRLLGEPREVAVRLKRRICDEMGVTGSVGVAPNKFLAKLASDLHKPDGLTVIEPQDIDRVLPPLPVTRLWGIGPATAARLERLNIRTIGQLRRLGREWFEQFFGSDGERYYSLSHGIDYRPVVPDHDARSIGHEQTFGVDVSEPEEVRRVLLEQAEQVGFRLRRAGLLAAGVSVKIRFGQFQTISRSTTLDPPTDSTAALWQAARGLFERWTFQPVRLIGLAAERLVQAEPGQMGLFGDPAAERQKALDGLADRINERFGRGTIHRGGPG